MNVGYAPHPETLLSTARSPEPATGSGRLFRRPSVDDFDAGESLFFDIESRLKSPCNGVIDGASEAEIQEYFPLPLKYGLAER
jgi:hypothetical protein